jgi:hypothetical protein
MNPQEIDQRVTNGSGSLRQCLLIPSDLSGLSGL